MGTWTAYHSRSISPQEQTLYDHLLVHAELETPQELIERFQSLFIDGVGYPSYKIVAALDEIVSSKGVDQYFHYILNRCCHILVNRWQSRPQLQSAVPELIRVLEQGPSREITEYSRARQVRKLHEVVSDFTETDQYLTLKRLAQLISSDGSSDHNENRPLGALIERYPYLYKHCLVSEDSPEEHQRHIRHIQAKAQHQFEVNLSHYITYRVRRCRIKKQQSPDEKLKRLRPITNPTLLSDCELVASLNQFLGNVDDGRTYCDSAQLFLKQNRAVKFGDFKRDLYQYLTESVHASYGNRKFNWLLYQQIAQTLPENEDQTLNDFLLVRTCSQLLNFLVVESSQRPQHFVFVDLINNLGPLLTTGLLLKIVLLCRKVKPYLERRFSILFSHYEATTQSSVYWLVKMLENLNIALSLTFGSVDVSAVMNS
ncbi:MAG: hypothetical protein F6K42_12875 [Leptolyngbya sp. SIO1D8]|nr:hypothetical protein [Leptolyngbya sp. SIO1D8]